MAKRHGVDKIRVFTDSELFGAERPGGGEPEVRGAPGAVLAGPGPLPNFTDRELSWVPREMNTEADLLAGAALPLRPSRG